MSRTAPQAVAAVGMVLALLGAGLAAGALPVAEPPSHRPAVRPEVPVTARDDLAQPSNNSPVVLADPTEPRFVVLANRVDARDFSCGLQVSGDGGESWVPARPVPTLPPGAEKCYAPEVAFDGDGVLHYLFVGLQGKGNEPMGAFLTTSRDRARTFSAPRRVLGPLNFAVRMAIDPTAGRRGRIHLVWLHATADPVLGGFSGDANPILAAHSDDGGRTFSEPVRVSDPDRRRVVAPAVTVGAGGRVHIAYYDLEGDARDYHGLEGPTWEGSWTVVASSSGDAGRTFGRGVVVDDGVTPPERPMLIFTMPPPALAAHGERVCAAWTDARHGDADVLLRCSADTGRTWNAPLRLNDDAVANGKRQYLPRLGVAPGGRIDAVFLDRRRDATNATNDTYYTYSRDGGRTFARNRRLTTQDSFATIGARYAGPSAAGQYEFGGRLGLLSGRSSVLAAWPDTRYSLDGTAQDIFAVRVDFAAGGRPWWARALGGAVLVAGLAALAAAVARPRRARRSSGATPRTREPAGRAPVRSSAPFVVGLVVAVSVIAVVGGGFGGPPPSLPPRPQVVHVTQREYRFEYAPPARPGRTVFRVRNAGGAGHRFAVFPLPEDMPRIDLQLAGSERRAINSVADVPRRKEMAPGESEVFALDLVPGQRYAFLCFLITEDDELHADLGMNTEFRVRGDPALAPTTAPTTNGPGR